MFKSIAEAFNYYKNLTNAQLEKRAQEIQNDIEKNPDADIQAYNIELTGIAEAKRNNDDKQKNAPTPNQNPGKGEDGSTTKRSKFSMLSSRSLESKNFEIDSVIDTREYRSAFFKTMLGQNLSEVERNAYNVAQHVAEKRADAFNASSDSLAVLPTTTLDEVVKKARTIGGLLGECRAFSVPTKIAIPVGTPASRAAWHTEGAEVTAEQVNTSNVIFDGNEIIKVFSLSAKTRKMSINAFESYLTDELSACVMETIGDSLINGTGTNQGTGLEAITWTTGTNQIAATTSIGYTDVIDAVALLKRGYAQGAKWAMNNSTLYKVFYGMLDGNKRPIFIADPKDESIGKILGFPVIIDDNIADNNIYLGNFSQYLGYNLPDGIAVESSRESSFRKGLIDYRALAIADTKPIVNEAFVKLTVTSK